MAGSHTANHKRDPHDPHPRMTRALSLLRDIEGAVEAFLGLDNSPGPLGRNDHAAPEHLPPTPHHPPHSKPAPHPDKHPKPKAARKGWDPYAAAFKVAKEEGWLPAFRDAATAHGFTPELLMGIGYVETGLNPKYLREPGDHGHGFGLMQMDNRSYGPWIATGAWKVPKACIEKAAQILADKVREIQAARGKVRAVYAHEVAYKFTGAPIAGAALIRVAVADYNCGLWGYYHYSKGHDPDRGTTGGHYSQKVLAHAARFRPLLEQDAQAQASAAPASSP